MNTPEIELVKKYDSVTRDMTFIDGNIINVKSVTSKYIYSHIIEEMCVCASNRIVLGKILVLILFGQMHVFIHKKPILILIVEHFNLN